jgi:hypothetical protein
MVGAAASRHVGLTGGKQLVVLVGQKKALVMAVKNLLGRRRCGGSVCRTDTKTNRIY